MKTSELKKEIREEYEALRGEIKLVSVEEWLDSIVDRIQESVCQKMHDTEEGYCCACPYDIAGFKEHTTKDWRAGNQTKDFGSILTVNDNKKLEEYVRILRHTAYEEGKREGRNETLESVREEGKASKEQELEVLSLCHAVITAVNTSQYRG